MILPFMKTESQPGREIPPAVSLQSVEGQGGMDILGVEGGQENLHFLPLPLFGLKNKTVETTVFSSHLYYPHSFSL